MVRFPANQEVCEKESATQQTPPVPALQNAPEIPFECVPFPKLAPNSNLGEMLGVAINSKGHVAVLHHPGNAGTGPVYGGATSQILIFDQDGNCLREVGRGVYGLAYGHYVRFDKYDNLWVTDKAAMSVMKFNPEGRVLMNLGRRDEGAAEPRYPRASPPPTPVDGYFNGCTDVAWDDEDNIYVSDGYYNSRIAKFNKYGEWIKSFGAAGTGGVHANENPGHFSNPHSLGIDRQGDLYVADRGNRRIQVFDLDGNFKRFIFLTVPYDKTRHPVLGNMPPNRPDETHPETICITDTPTQYLYTIDKEPGRIYKLSLPDGKILGMLGRSGRQSGEFNWAHQLACLGENVLFVADMNNWRIQKLILHPEKVKAR
jgi:sugar lactone lactonase YvrE